MFNFNLTNHEHTYKQIKANIRTKKGKTKKIFKDIESVLCERKTKQPERCIK